jgi:hypothetical protein
MRIPKWDLQKYLMAESAALRVSSGILSRAIRAWFTWSWVEQLTGCSRDRWALQIAAGSR